MSISDIIDIIKKTALESGFDLEDAPFEKINEFYKKSTKLNKLIDTKVKSGYTFSSRELNAVTSPFIRAYLDMYIDEHNIDIIDDTNTINPEIYEDYNTEFGAEPEYVKVEYTSDKAISDQLQKSVLFTAEEEKEIFQTIKPYTQRIQELEATIRKVSAKAVLDYKNEYEAKYGTTCVKGYKYQQAIDEIVQDVSKNSKEGKELFALRNEIKPYVTKIYEANVKWIKKLAIKNNYRSSASCDANDIFSMGYEGFLRAVINFDVDRGYKFSTYATWWINQAITRGIADEARTIRIPVHLFEKVNKYHRVYNMLTSELNREPNEEEIAAKLNLSVEEVRSLIKNSVEPTSLETPVGEEDDSVLGDFIFDEDTMTPEDYVMREQLKVAVRKVLKELNQREQRVLELRFGLTDGRPRTLEEVGKEFNVTRERIRQIESKALKKLRIRQRAVKLEDFVDKKKKLI